MMKKKCCRCSNKKPLDSFHKSEKGLHGVHSICKECKSAYMKQYSLSGKMKLAKDKYKASPHGAAKIREYIRSESNKNIQRNYSKKPSGRTSRVNRLAKYRAIKKQAMPSWVTMTDIRNIYEACPTGQEVDHIVPLQGANVSGLHVPWNLQYLTREENAFKSNKFDGTMNNDQWRGLYD